MNVHPSVHWKYQVDDRVFVFLPYNLNYEQPIAGFKIIKRISVLSSPAYLVIGPYPCYSQCQRFLETEVELVGDVFRALAAQLIRHGGVLSTIHHQQQQQLSHLLFTLP